MYLIRYFLFWVCCSVATASFAAMPMFDRVVTGDGKLTTVTHNEAAFSTLLVEGEMIVTVKSGKQNSVTISADSNILPLIIAKVEKQSLRLALPAEVTFKQQQPIRVVVTVADLQLINLQGRVQFSALLSENKKLNFMSSGNVTAIINGKVTLNQLYVQGSSVVNMNNIQKGDLAIKISGASRVNLKGTDINVKEIDCAGSANLVMQGINSTQLQVMSAGSTAMTLTGKAGQLQLRNMGNSTIDAAGLTAKSASVQVYGIGQVKVHAAEQLKANIMGSGTIWYAGAPKSVTRSVFGNGEIKVLG